MSERTFDELLLAVQNAVLDAQETLRLRHERAMRSCFGESSARVELAGAGEPPVLVEIPFSRFRQKRPLRLSAFALEIGCELRQRHDGNVVVRIKKGHPPAKCAHRLLIAFDGGEFTPGKLLVDGMPLRILAPHLVETSEAICAEQRNS